MEKQQNERKKNSRKKPAGRQEGEQEVVIKISELKSRMPGLISSFHDSKTAAKQLSDDIKAAAKASGLLASVVRRRVIAQAGDDFDEKKREITQLALAFDVDPNLDAE